MREIVHGLWHWSTHHEGIGSEVSSWYLSDGRVLIDPMVRAGEGDRIAELGGATDILLANRHHLRDSEALARELGATVRCHRAGLDDIAARSDVEPFEFGDELPGGVLATEIGSLCPEETALCIPALRAVAFADAVIRGGDGAVGFVPDSLMGDDPESVKTGLRTALRRLLDDHDFDRLLLAHGGPVLEGGREQIERLATA